MHVTWCSSLLSPSIFKGGIVIAPVRLSVRPSVCMLCSILLNHWTKSNQVWCARFSYELGVRQDFFFLGGGASPWGPGEGSKVNYQIRKVNFKDFTLIFMFVPKNKINVIFIMSPGSYSRDGTWGCLWVNFFSKHGRVAYQIEGDGEQNGEQVKCSPYGQTCDL